MMKVKKREEPSDNWEETSGAVDRSSGPWNKSAPAPAPVVETIVTEPPEPVQTGGVYRPPGAREGGRPRRAQQGPPEIYLAAAPPRARRRMTGRSLNKKKKLIIAVLEFSPCK